MTQCQTAHHQGADLVAAVTGGIHQHGHEGDQQGQRGKGFLIVGGDHAGQGGCHPEKRQQPPPQAVRVPVSPAASSAAPESLRNARLERFFMF